MTRVLPSASASEVTVPVSDKRPVKIHDTGVIQILELECQSTIGEYEQKGRESLKVSLMGRSYWSFCSPFNNYQISIN